MKPILFFLALNFLAGGPWAFSTESSCTPSQLWGYSGEKFDPGGRLSDYSKVGYREGRPTPKPPVVSQVTDFGARGDDEKDDTLAFEKALQQVGVGTLLIPAGKYILSRPLNIHRGNLVLRGEGRSQTVLLFTKSWAEICSEEKRSRPSFCRDWEGEGTPPWTRGPGFIQVTGEDFTKEAWLTSVKSRGQRGDFHIEVEDASSMVSGEMYALVMSDPKKDHPQSGTLLRELLDNKVEIKERGFFGKKNIVRFLFRVVSVEENRVKIDRPLPYKTKNIWKPRIYSFHPTIQEIGIEDLTVQFPHSFYQGHFEEEGYNGIQIREAAHCWVKNVRIRNSDNPLRLQDTYNCSLDKILIDDISSRRTLFNSTSGHHGITVSAGSNNLVQNFEFLNRFVHDLTVTNFTYNAVFSKGKGVDLTLDHHHAYNHASLFTDIDLGKGRDPFDSGGGGNLSKGPNTGAFTTYWNVRAERVISAPPREFGPSLNFVGVPMRYLDPSAKNWWVESREPQTLCTPNLYEAMKRKAELSSF